MSGAHGWMRLLWCTFSVKSPSDQANIDRIILTANRLFSSYMLHSGSLYVLYRMLLKRKDICTNGRSSYIMIPVGRCVATGKNNASHGQSPQQPLILQARRLSLFFRTMSASPALPQASQAILDLTPRAGVVLLPEMRTAMANAEVGDDVMKEDPTVNKLQARFAELFGKEAALFLPTNRMAQATSIMAHVPRNDVVVADACTYLVKQDLEPSITRISVRPVHALQTGASLLDTVGRSIEDDSVRLLWVESTTPTLGGQALSEQVMDNLGDAVRHRCPLHLDGTHIFHASLALGVAPSRLAQSADSISLSLSRSLGAIGAMVIGTATFIQQIRRLRKAMGGGMRQAGVLGAAGLVAVDNWHSYASRDLDRTKQMADALQSIDGVQVDPVVTNVIRFRLNTAVIATSASVLAEECEKMRLRLEAVDEHTLSCYIHGAIAVRDVEAAANIFRKVIQSQSLSR